MARDGAHRRSGRPDVGLHRIARRRRPEHPQHARGSDAGRPPLRRRLAIRRDGTTPAGRTEHLTRPLPYRPVAARAFSAERVAGTRDWAVRILTRTLPLFARSPRGVTSPRPLRAWDGRRALFQRGVDA